jgi:RimJ/RimL family protein N-acetyltransferase
MGPQTVEAEEQWYDDQVRAGNKVFAIETQDGVLIGNISLHNIHVRCHHAELGIVIGEKDYWGKGYGTDAITTLLDYCFNELNLQRVWLRVFSFNQRGIRCYEKCGFVVEGRLRRHMWRHGSYHDELHMGILREEWHARQHRQSPPTP